VGKTPALLSTTVIRVRPHTLSIDFWVYRRVFSHGTEKGLSGDVVGGLSQKDYKRERLFVFRQKFAIFDTIFWSRSIDGQYAFVPIIKI